MSGGISKILIEKTAEYVAKIGNSFINTLKEKYKNESKYNFLFPSDPDHNKFLARIEYYRSLSAPKVLPSIVLSNNRT